MPLSHGPRVWTTLVLATAAARCGGSGAGGPSAGGPAAGQPTGAGGAAAESLVVAAVAPSAVPAAQPPVPSPAAMRPLAESAHLFTSQTAQGGEPGVRVLRDAAAWEAAWRELQAGLAAGPAPAVDFARDMVVVVAAGERSSGGHTVRVDGTSTAADGALLLHVTATAPGDGCMSAAVVTSPVDVVRVPRAPGAVRATTRTVRQPC